MKWTEEEDAILREECARGHGCIARAMKRLPDRSYVAIRLRIERKWLMEYAKPWLSPTEKGGLPSGKASLALRRRKEEG